MDDRRESNVKSQVGGREDADGVFVVAGTKSAADGEVAAEFGFLAITRFGADVKRVVDRSYLSVCCCREVAGNEVREGQFLFAFGELEGLGVIAEKIPFVEVVDLAGAFATTILHGLLGRDGGFEEHDNTLHYNVASEGSDFETAREQGARRDGRCVVEHHGWRLHDHLQLHGLDERRRPGRRCASVRGGMRGRTVIGLAFPVPRFGRALGFADGSEGRTLEVIHAGAANVIHSVRARALSLLEDVLERRRVVVGVGVFVVRVRVPGPTTEVNAQDFAGHACGWARPGSVTVGDSASRGGLAAWGGDRREPEAERRKKLGLGWRCCRSWLACRRLRLGECARIRSRQRLARAGSAGDVEREERTGDKHARRSQML